MLRTVITLTPGHRNEFIDWQEATLCTTVLPIMNVNTHVNSTLGLLERVYGLREFTHKWLQYTICSDYRPLFTAQDNWTIVQYITERLRPFQYSTWSLSMSHSVTLHHIITVYNDMFDHMDGVMRTFAKEMTQGKEDLFLIVKLAEQMLST